MNSMKIDWICHGNEVICKRSMYNEWTASQEHPGQPAVHLYGPTVTGQSSPAEVCLFISSPPPQHLPAMQSALLAISHYWQKLSRIAIESARILQKYWNPKQLVFFFLKICSRGETLTDSDLDFKTFDPGQRLLKDSFNINEESALLYKISNCLFSSVSSTIFHLFQAIFSFYSLIPPSHRLYPAENLQAPKKSGDLPEIRAGYRKPHSLLFRLR